ncbi:MAG: TIGR03790 family protein [Verrucomicrobiales bacterium]
MRRLFLAGFFCGSCLGAEPDAYPQETVVLYNANTPESQRLAVVYAKARKIPEDHLIGVNTPPRETISRAEFQTTIESPLRETFSERKWWKIGGSGTAKTATETVPRLLVLMYGVPLRIAEEPVLQADGKPPAAAQQNQASVDSELTLLGLWERPFAGGLNNPYFGKDRPFREVQLPIMFMVARVDAPTPKICERMIGDALAVEATGLWGRVYLDLARKGPGYEEGDRWLLGAGKLLGTAGWPVIIDAHPSTLPTNYPMTDAAVYFGWWIRNADGPLLNPAFRFRRGAVAYHMHSFAAETLHSESANWCGPLLARGAAAVLGTTWEPYLSYCTREDIFTDRLLKGYNLAEAAWMATPTLSWMNVVVGDPLYRPFARMDSPKPQAENVEFQLYRSLVRRYGNEEDKELLMRPLQATAEKRKSGMLWEALGLLAQTYFPNDLKRAAQCFESAGKTYPKTADRIRAYLHVPDMEWRNNHLEGAIADLKRVITEFPKEPESEAARVWLNILRPAPDRKP